MNPLALFRRSQPAPTRKPGSSLLPYVPKKKEYSSLKDTDLCVKCGLCLPHCPTYLATLDEGDSPRGRITLMQGLMQGHLRDDAAVRRHLESCVQCRACEAVCPSLVPFGRLMDAARAELIPPGGRGPVKGYLLRHDGSRRVAARSFRLAQMLGLVRLASWLGSRRRPGMARAASYVLGMPLNRGLRAMPLSEVPRLPAPGAVAAPDEKSGRPLPSLSAPKPTQQPAALGADTPSLQLDRAGRPDGGAPPAERREASRQGQQDGKGASGAGGRDAGKPSAASTMAEASNAASGKQDGQDNLPVATTKAKARAITLFTGCTGEALDARAVQAARQVLECLGYRVSVPEHQVCCGALDQHAGRPKAAADLARRNQTLMGGQGGPVLSLNSGCRAHLKSEVYAFPEVGDHALMGRVADLCVLLAEEDLKPLELRQEPLRVAVHTPCTLRHVLKEHEALEALARRLPGAEVLPLPENALCCGAAGSYMLTHPKMADHLLSPKLDALQQLAPDVLLTANVGCAIHFVTGLKRRRLPIQVLGPAELLQARSQACS
ncbi:(Fe-S)-binding protein [Ectothiorhodospira sp. BSL-9]|uniref:(Fe-S)-binding protein n=1 Tax=Ectothiorhodospira sp. BSL-9 TaxID=1442136 RepID=UPI0007B505BE|nr:(Fe-S)-binding protein [Ectothiorhodospira sp. BSL-9]